MAFELPNLSIDQFRTRRFSPLQSVSTNGIIQEIRKEVLAREKAERKNKVNVDWPSFLTSTCNSGWLSDKNAQSSTEVNKGQSSPSVARGKVMSSRNMGLGVRNGLMRAAQDVETDASKVEDRIPYPLSENITEPELADELQYNENKNAVKDLVSQVKNGMLLSRQRYSVQSVTPIKEETSQPWRPRSLGDQMRVQFQNAGNIQPAAKQSNHHPMSKRYSKNYSGHVKDISKDTEKNRHAWSPRSMTIKNDENKNVEKKTSTPALFPQHPVRNRFGIIPQVFSETISTNITNSKNRHPTPPVQRKKEQATNLQAIVAGLRKSFLNLNMEDNTLTEEDNVDDIDQVNRDTGSKASIVTLTQ